MKIDEALKNAMETEVEGRELYRMLANSTRDRKAKRVFMDLAAEEDMHLHFLKKLHEALTGRKGELPKLPRVKSAEDLKSPIFSDEFKEMVTKDDIAALSKGMKLELESVEFYRKMAESAEDEKLKKLFEDLMEWEKGHYEMLKKQRNLFEEILGKVRSLVKGS